MQYLILIGALSLALALANLLLGLFLRSVYAVRYESARDAFELLYVTVSILLTALILIQAEAWFFAATTPSVLTNTWLIGFVLIPLAVVDLVIGVFAAGWMYGKLSKMYDPAQ